MHYILTLWLLWAGEDWDIIQVSPFTSIEACTNYANHFTQQIKADGVVASRWVCEPEREEDV